MVKIAFLDIEVDPNTQKILDIGGVKNDKNQFHQNSLVELEAFLQDVQFICGHNFLEHDLKYLDQLLERMSIGQNQLIDTLLLSSLLFPAKPYHALNKDYKTQFESSNSPLNDAIITQDLFYLEVEAFKQLNQKLQHIFYLLLKEQYGFKAFFAYIAFEQGSYDLLVLIYEVFSQDICEQADLEQLIDEYPVELAYTLSLIDAKNRYSITPKWLILKYPKIEQIMFMLRNSPCVSGCGYCHQALDVKIGLKQFFGYDTYRSYDGKPLQEQAANAAIQNKSILAILPTGGGKSITFQVPALMSGESSKGLTVVISPLQSLMKDQVDNLEKSGITEAVTINGLLDPIERAKSLERVKDGSSSLLYISPESLRSRTIELALLERKIARFVIDEAHCFSSWGQDFRVDYLYIADFIQNLQNKKCLSKSIPVSCFTATAKPRVVEDICQYFKERLGLELEIFSAKVTRKNLSYRVFDKKGDDEKYQALRRLIEEKNCPTIIYVSRVKRVKNLVEKLTYDGFVAKGFYGKMESQEKITNQESFISGETPIMVATSAFGMGVDKKDVGAVIHYDISDSLENYVQEAGRAGRDEALQADCFILFDEEDLSKHFILLNQTKLSMKEIQQIWSAIKEMTRFRASISHSSLEIARKAGWDDTVVEIETRVTTAIAALEEAGYLKRGQNMPRIFANSILCKNAQEAIAIINKSENFVESQKEKAIRIIKKLFSTKSQKLATDEVAESRIDYMSDSLGLVKEEVIQVISLLRQENILADTKDLTAFIKKSENINKSLSIVEVFIKIETLLYKFTEEQESSYSLKELNEKIEAENCTQVTPNKIKTIINFWTIKQWIKKSYSLHRSNHIEMMYSLSKESLQQKLEKRHVLAKFIVNYLYEQYTQDTQIHDLNKEEYLVEFSVHRLKSAYDNAPDLFKITINLEDVEDSLFYLSRIEAVKIEGGFLVIYNRLSLERLELNNLKRYTKEDYKKLSQFYESKVEQIHIVGEYAKKMISDYKEALQFVEDYFQLDYGRFLKKYFSASKGEFLKQKMTATKFQALFGELSPQQLKIINDSDNQHIVVAAGPGSGKTRVLVHKLASLLLMEDVKHEQLLMLTFSRAAAHEFKSRLIQLIGNAAAYVEIKTFHSYCFDLLGKVGTLELSDEILQRTVEKIKNGDVETNRITKMVLVIDEAQDMNEAQFSLIRILMEKNEEMRVIAVGDDDQTIYAFVQASPKYLQQLIDEHHAVKYELVTNYRSKANLVVYSNQFAKKISQRLKEFPVIAMQQQHGEIKLVRAYSKHLINRVIQEVLQTALIGSSCVLTQTNEEAAQIAGLLLQHGLPAKLIQSNEGFSLYNLLEVRAFIYYLNLTEHSFIIDEKKWQAAIQIFKKNFHSSENLDICLNLISVFEKVNPSKKYQSDFISFTKESKLEDFYHTQGDIVFVSTIHKAKGREFNHVFLLLDNFNAHGDDGKRKLYVALTRAKNNLSIICNNNILDSIEVQGLNKVEDYTQYSAPNELVLYLTLKDVFLDYFLSQTSSTRLLMSGDDLVVDINGCKNNNGNYILKFSNKFKSGLTATLDKGYKFKRACVNFVVLWTKEDTEKEVRVILPKLYLEK